MGFDLYARRNPTDRHFYMGAFSFSWMLDAGVGLPIRTGPGIHPISYYFVPDDRGRDPHANDGFRVSAREAKAMALAAAGLARVERARWQEWRSLSEADHERYEKMRDVGVVSYRLPVREDFIEKVERFSEWAWKSGGFAIS